MYCKFRKRREQEESLYISYFARSGCQPIAMGGVNLYRSQYEPLLGCCSA
ncbi:hypothetical protein HMPREF3185_00223 [Porphyromonas somerae]|uniref:Uncharacterized protein n=1 Tax=Porphyromonas somerae TaxID=322095 RepID=A0A134BE72_9PORP|nr:hypothetical protein HMPREF3184_00223 [Porphyromonadaceae bacterium KA00676]KXB78254.1 hypothetical protein HMPREF3185_00223 [Porphyromonas somerae]